MHIYFEVSALKGELIDKATKGDRIHITAICSVRIIYLKRSAKRTASRSVTKPCNIYTYVCQTVSIKDPV